MELIYYFFKIKVDRFASGLNLLKIIFLVIMGITTFCNGYFLADAVDNILNFIEISTIIQFIKYFIYFSLTLSIIIPSYSLPSKFIPSLYPQTNISKFIFQLFFDFFNLFYLFFAVSMVLFSAFSERLNLFDILNLLIVFVNAHFVKRALHLLIGAKWVFNFQALFFFILIAISTILLGLNLDNETLINIIYMFSGFFMLFILESYLIEFRHFGYKSNSTDRFASFSRIGGWLGIIFSRKVAYPLITAYVLKLVLFTMYILNPSGVDDEEKLIIEPVMIIFSSPMLIFNYIYNNLWGHYKAIWISMDVAQGTGANALFFFIKIISIPLCVDIAISSIFFISKGYTLISYYSFYFVSLSFIVCIGFWGSLLFAIPIKPEFSFSVVRVNYVVGITTVLAVLFTYPLVFIVNKLILLVLFCVYMLVAFLGVRAALGLYSEQKEKLFNSLFK
jgi:hypothetical protein